MTFIFLIIAIFVIIIQRTFTNVFFLLYLLLGIIWFIAARIIKGKLKDPENSYFALIKTFVSITYWLGMLVVVIVVNLMGSTVSFM